MSWKIHSIEELKNVINQNSSIFNENSCFAFRGEMGAGKTTMIQHILEHLGITNLQGSPTYSIINHYSTSNGKSYYHMDCYRLKNEFEAFDLGIEEILSEKNPIFIEWAEKIEKLLPSDTVWIDLRVSHDQIRTIEITNENRS